MAKTGGLRSNKLVFLIIALLMGAVFVGALSFLQNIYQTENYYVLNQDVPMRSQLAPEMFTEVTTSKGTAPVGSLKPADVQSGQVFTRHPLFQGEVVNFSDVGGLDDISVGIPDSWLVTSFPVPADNAVGGRIQRGVYFDMMVTTDEGTFYPFVNVLCLDTSVSLSGASNSNAVNTDEAKAGQTQYYYVGMNPEDAALLQSLVRQYGTDLKLVLSPRQNEYQEPDLAAYEGMFNFDSDNYDLKNGSPGTNNTFTDFKRDEFGRPADRDENGNVQFPVKCGNNVNTSVGSPSECTTIDNSTYGEGAANGGDSTDTTPNPPTTE